MDLADPVTDLTHHVTQRLNSNLYDESFSDPNQVDYRGCQTKTRAGNDCMEWAQQIVTSRSKPLPELLAGYGI